MILEMLLKRKFRHILNRMSAAWAKLFHEQKLSHDGCVLKYMFFDNRSNQLVVSFPACAPNASRYNYVRTLKPFKVDKLFLLDDFADNHQGCYLVRDDVEALVYKLLKTIVDKGRYEKILFIGSSKGGYSALNFSFLIPNVDVVIGAPQYSLGSYLNKPDTIENLKFLLYGDVDEQKIKVLDDRLKNRILSSEIKPLNVFIHYSDKEATYDCHVKWMLEDLRHQGIAVSENVEDYPLHSDMVRFFPSYLDKKLKELLA